MGNKFGKNRKSKKERKSEDNVAKNDPMLYDKQSIENSITDVSEQVSPRGSEVETQRKSMLSTLERTVADDASQYDFANLASRTHFSEREIAFILTHVRGALETPIEKEVIITKRDFERLIGLENSTMYLNRIFQLLDKKASNSLSFQDFVEGLSVLSEKEVIEKKYDFAFNLLDQKSTGSISKQEVIDMLKACLEDSSKCGVEIVLSDENIEKIVDETFAKANLNKENAIERSEYERLCRRQTDTANFLTVDITGLLCRLEKRNSLRGLSMNKKTYDSADEIKLEV